LLAFPIPTGIGAAPVVLPIAMSGGGEDAVDQVFMDWQLDQ
jgi:hypothetical protein